MAKNTEAAVSKAVEPEHVGADAGRDSGDRKTAGKRGPVSSKAPLPPRAMFQEKQPAKGK